MTHPLTRKSVLVTGGTGFVGSHLVQELLSIGARVTTTYLTENPHSYFFTQQLSQQVRKVHLDITDFEAVLDLITKSDCEYIFHLAAQPLVEVAYYNPRRTLNSNIMGTVNVLEAARLYPRVKGVIVASSDKAYGKLSKGKYVETNALRGDHPYEVSKSAADLICNSYYQTYHLPVVTTRFGNIYGEGDLNFSRIIPGALWAASNNTKLELRSDGSHTRDYLYVKDVVAGYIQLASQIDAVKGQAYNFGSVDTFSVLELLKQIEAAIGKKINYSIVNSAKNEIPYQSLNYQKIKQAVGWKPQQRLSQVMPQIFEWYQHYVHHQL